MKYLLAAVAGAFGLGAYGPVFADSERLATSTRYDVEYPVVDYSSAARRNRVYQLQQQLQGGKLKLQWEPGTGYLRSLLKALDIDEDSQVLVHSRTSLQIEHISPRTPRAVYFNDDTYVGFVANSPLIEITAIDVDKGAVFYGFENSQEFAPSFTREGGRCLTCHDTYAMSGGGVPRVMVLSSPVDHALDTRTITAGEDVDDSTPISMRWGGWYVTGNTGKVRHLGNLPLREGRGVETLQALKDASHNVADLKAFFDTGKYPTPHSDVVALTVLEHQTRMHNLITRVDYKIRTVLAREGSNSASGTAGALRSWADISPNDHKRLQQMMEPLVKALFMHDAVKFDDRMTGSTTFAARFSKLGPVDSAGRSLRELDLQRRLFRYPLSYMIYSEQYDALPDYARKFVNGRIVEVLQGRDTTGLSASLTAAERTAVKGILMETKPEIAALLRADGSGRVQ